MTKTMKSTRGGNQNQGLTLQQVKSLLAGTKVRARVDEVDASCIEVSDFDRIRSYGPMELSEWLGVLESEFDLVRIPKKVLASVEANRFKTIVHRSVEPVVGNSLTSKLTEFKVGEKVRYVGEMPSWKGKTLTVFRLGENRYLAGRDQKHCTFCTPEELEHTDARDPRLGLSAAETKKAEAKVTGKKTPSRAQAIPAAKGKPSKTSAVHYTIPELMKKLAASTDPDEKRALRRTLRKLGHKGGLRKAK